MTKRPKPRHTNRLTIKRHISKNLAPGKYVDGGGLALLVSPIGSKSWTFRFERNGRDRAMVLGSLRDLFQTSRTPTFRICPRSTDI